jgi:PAS domain S-box-containing protein
VRENPILLTIDDEPAIRSSFRRFLEDYDYEVIEAEDGKKGIESIKKSNPDIVLVDLRMPVVDGLEVLAFAKENYPNMPIIVVSGTGIIADVVEALRLGAWDYLLKPVKDIEVILHAVENALDKSRLISENKNYQEKLEELVQKRTNELKAANENLMSEISIRFKAEEDLRQSEMMLSSILKSVPDIIYRLDPDGNISFINEAVERYGYKQSDLIETKVLEIVHPEDRDKFRIATHERRTGERRTKNLEIRLLKAPINKLTSFGEVVNEPEIIFLVEAEGIYSESECIEENYLGTQGIARDITSLKEAQRKVVEREANLKAVFDGAKKVAFVNAAISFKRREIVEFSIGAEKLFGYNRDEIIGQQLDVLFGENQEVDFETLIELVETSREDITTEFPMRGKSGETFWAISTLNPKTDENGELVNILLVAIDISSRKEKEEEIVYQSKVFKTINELLQKSIIARNYREVASAFVEVIRSLTNSKYGVISEVDKSKNIINIAFSEIQTGDYDADISKAIIDNTDLELRVLNSGKTIIDEYTDNTTGSPVRVFRLGIPLLFDKKSIGIIKLEKIENEYINQDVRTVELLAAVLAEMLNKKLAEDQLKKLSKVVEQSPNSIIIANRSGNITYVNNSFISVYEYTFEEVVGQPVYFTMSAKEYEDNFKKIWENVLKGKAWKGEQKNRKKSGVEILEITNFLPIVNEDNEIENIIVLKEDITEKKKLEEQYRQAQKMEAIGRMAGGVAHDFNNLLTAITGSAELALMSLPDDHQIYNDINDVIETATRAGELTRQLLTFSRKRSVVRKVINFNTIINNLKRMLVRIIGEDIEFTVTVQEDLWKIKADPSQMEQIVLNMVVNARDAMPEGGKLTLKTKNVILDSEVKNDLFGIVEGPCIELTVSDTGTGISEDVKTFMFEPFFTTKKEGEGTGLGLATVFQILQNCGGKVEVESSVGNGSTFKIYIPFIKEEEPSIAHLKKDSELYGNESILLVEDDQNVRNTIIRILEKFGYKITVATSGIEALEIARREDFHVDMVVTDVVMPLMNGDEFAEKFKLIHSEVPILFMSGYIDNAFVINKLMAEDMLYIQKPFKPVEIVQEVRKIINEYSKQ